MVESARLRHADGRVEDVPCAGVFAYIGLDPNTEFLPAQVEKDAAGFVRTDDSLLTRMPGVSAIGAVRSGFGGTLSHAIEDAQRVVRAVKAQLT
jgi:thioredoxin reductase (NADPH)